MHDNIKKLFHVDGYEETPWNELYQAIESDIKKILLEALLATRNYKNIKVIQEYDIDYKGMEYPGGYVIKYNNPFSSNTFDDYFVRKLTVMLKDKLENRVEKLYSSKHIECKNSFCNRFLRTKDYLGFLYLIRHQYNKVITPNDQYIYRSWCHRPREFSFEVKTNLITPLWYESYKQKIP